MERFNAPPEAPLPYARQSIDEADIRRVVEVLRSDWLTGGPAVGQFERALAEYTAAAAVVAVSSGTAALHAAMFALNIGAGDEVIVPAMTFAATANAVVYQGGTPVFADVDPRTLLLDPADAAARITARTRAIVAVDYAGQPCDYDELAALARSRGLALVADGCHSLGAAYNGRRVGSLAALTAFSFHPVKPITTGEGGAVATADPTLARRLRQFRNHGITTDARQRHASGRWHYEMTELGYNYRLSDIHAALGLAQLERLEAFRDRRERLARHYDVRLGDARLGELPAAEPLAVRPGVVHARHLYVVRLPETIDRDAVLQRLRAQGIGAGVHYPAVHLHPYYRQRFHTAAGQCPAAEAAAREIITLPLFVAMEESDVERVVGALAEAVAASGRTSTSRAA